ncbi:alkaline-phosphatase-like protein [Pyronema omphalodes]|nr:alkaline-phosphatase-like protein [Pyronema omphalodes]
MAPRGSVRSLFARASYDRDAAEYSSVHAPSEYDQHDGRDSRDSQDSSSEVGGDDTDVLREEEEREKLLAGGVFSRTNSVRIGKKVRGSRRKAKEVAEMMGGKRLGMEDGGEFGLGDDEAEDEEDDEESRWGEKMDAKPRKPSKRRILVVSCLLMTFLGMVVFGSLGLSRGIKNGAPRLEFWNGTTGYAKTTVLISLDGFRADFLGRNITPTLDSFMRSGVSPDYMTPSFPSVTFPNHWTLVTGLIPEAHGIVSNSFWDPELKKEFYYTDPQRSLDEFWWGGEPIWKTVENQGGIAAVHMWPGSESRGHGARYTDHFNSSETLDRKTDRILNWLDMPANKRPSLIAAYVPNVDESGHKFGPNTTETNQVISDVDAAIHDLFMGLEKRNLTDIVNLVIVSDHGMASTSRDKLIYLDDLVSLDKIEHTDGWPLFGLRPFASHSVEEVYNEILSHHKDNSHWQVYLRDTTMPARYNFSRNQRIAPIWIIPEAGWTIVTKRQYPPGTKEDYHPKGLHGFDNLHPLMRAVFIARGPAFRHLHGGGKEWLGLDRESGVVDMTKVGGEVRMARVEPFQNTEVYRLLCKSLGLKEAPSNATLSELRLVKEVKESKEQKEQKEQLKPSSTSAGKTSSTPTASQTFVSPATPEESGKIIEVSPPVPPEGENVKGKGKGDGKSWWELLKNKANRLKHEMEEWWGDLWDEQEMKEGYIKGKEKEKEKEGKKEGEKGKEKEKEGGQ